MKKWEWKNDSRVKTRKGSLEQKWENYWSLMGEANGRMKRQRPDNIWIFYEVFYPLQNQKFELLVSECPPPEFSSLSRWVLTLVKLPYSEITKMNLFKMLDFQRILFSKKKKKGALETCHLFAQLNCENKSVEPDHQILNKYPIRRFSNSNHQFFWEP